MNQPTEKPSTAAETPAKLVSELKVARTVWHESYGVPVSQEHANFMQAIGNLTDWVEAISPPDERCGNCDHHTELHNIHGCTVRIQLEMGTADGKVMVDCPCSWDNLQAGSERGSIPAPSRAGGTLRAEAQRQYEEAQTECDKAYWQKEAAFLCTHEVATPAETGAEQFEEAAKAYAKSHLVGDWERRLIAAMLADFASQATGRLREENERLARELRGAKVTEDFDKTELSTLKDTLERVFKERDKLRAKLTEQENRHVTFMVQGGPVVMATDFDKMTARAEAAESALSALRAIIERLKSWHLQNDWERDALQKILAAATPGAERREGK